MVLDDFVIPLPTLELGLVWWSGSGDRGLGVHASLYQRLAAEPDPPAGEKHYTLLGFASWRRLEGKGRFRWIRSPKVTIDLGLGVAAQQRAIRTTTPLRSRTAVHYSYGLAADLFIGRRITDRVSIMVGVDQMIEASPEFWFGGPRAIGLVAIH